MHRPNGIDPLRITSSNGLLMMDYFRTFPYFAMSLLYLAVLLVILLCLPRRTWGSILLNGLMMIPFSLSSLFLEPQYWDPKRIAVCCGTGPEDIIFTFACGGLVWITAMWFVQDRLDFTAKPATMVRRFVFGTVAGLALGSLLKIMGAGPMTAIVLSFVMFTPVVFWLGGKLWPLPVAGLLGFPLVYFSIMEASFLLFPDFVNQWNPAVLWGPKIGKVPIDEITGAAAFGVAWPVFAAYILDARIKPPRHEVH
jgi:hypothetical protein